MAAATTTVQTERLQCQLRSKPRRELVHYGDPRTVQHYLTADFALSALET